MEASSVSSVPATGLLDLEKELVCSICTEVLYQPLTLLDCLHTFCGSCLKEWFSWQAQRYRTSPSSVPGANPYNCPSCRAEVRDTRPNAYVTTLLDMFVKANPSRDRTSAEKEEIGEKYKVGDIVIPKIEAPRRRSRDPRPARFDREGNDEEDRRLMEAARERSRLEVSGPHTTATRQARPHLDPGNISSSERSRSRENRDREERHRRRREEDRRRRRAAEHPESRPDQTANPGSAPTVQAVRDADTRQRERQIEHQSSLRSLISASDGEGAIEEEILRQILDEGLLEGINLDDMDGSQEDELSERIAEAYRRRHPSRSADYPPSDSSTSATHRRRQRSPNSQSSNVSQTRPRGPSADSRHPPVSRPYLLEATETAATASGHHRRSSSDRDRRQTSPNPRTVRTSSEETLPQQATRSATDLSDRPRSSDTTQRPRHMSDVRRTSTEPDAPRITEMWRRAAVRETNPDTARAAIAQSTTDSPQHLSPTNENPPMTSSGLLFDSSSPPRSNVPASRATLTSAGGQDTLSELVKRPQASTRHDTAEMFPEPSISCDHCSKPSIQYKLYKHCAKCSMNICLQCYRQKHGCRHWFGFGWSAIINFSTSAPIRQKDSAPPEPPHNLVGRKYLSPPLDARRRTQTDPESSTTTTFTSSNPSSRLQEGKFCDRCHEFSNACHWECSVCNEGEWGFCNQCVNTQHCCTHPLLPVAHKDFVPGIKQGAGIGSARRSSIPVHASVLPLPASATGASSRPTSSDGREMIELEGCPPYAVGQESEPEYLPLTFTTHCDICSYPIPPSSTRYHCPFHQTPAETSEKTMGDFDICTPCYTSLAKTGAISAVNGPNGWRRCPRGHRMVITGFEERGEGQRRVVVKDLVGGWLLKDEYFNTTGPPNRVDGGTWSWRETPGASASTRASRAKSVPVANPTIFPPSGGAGLHCWTKWSYLPDHEADPTTKDELLVPRGAEIREVEDVNGEWYSGVYMGDKGLFPGEYVQVVGAVGV